LTRIEADGVAIDWIVEVIKGIDYAMFAVPGAGAHVVASYFNSTLAGDYNQDGQVDAADYVVWRDSLGSTEFLAADGNGNSVIDAEDYTVWQRNFGTAPASRVLHPVPEPPSGWIGAAAALMASITSARLPSRRAPRSRC
jgi:hypothetical protein